MSNLHGDHVFLCGNESKLREISLKYFFLIREVKFMKKSQRIEPRTEKGTEWTPIKLGITDQAVIDWKGSEESEQLRK